MNLLLQQIYLFIIITKIIPLKNNQREVPRWKSPREIRHFLKRITSLITIATTTMIVANFIKDFFCARYFTKEPRPFIIKITLFRIFVSADNAYFYFLFFTIVVSDLCFSWPPILSAIVHNTFTSFTIYIPVIIMLHAQWIIYFLLYLWFW